MGREGTRKEGLGGVWALGGRRGKEAFGGSGPGAGGQWDSPEPGRGEGVYVCMTEKPEVKKQSEATEAMVCFCGRLEWDKRPGQAGRGYFLTQPPPPIFLPQEPAAPQRPPMPGRLRGDTAFSADYGVLSTGEGLWGRVKWGAGRVGTGGCVGS